MSNVFLNFLTSLMIGVGAPAGVPEADIDTGGDLLRGTPEEKLMYLYNHCNSASSLRRLARGFQSLASTYDEGNRSVEAELAYLLAIRFLERGFPSSDPDIGLAYEQLAGHYASLNERVLARKANAKALAVLRRHRVNYAVELAITLHNEAWLDIQDHRYSKAETCLREGLVLAKEKLGGSHILVGLLTNALGDLYVHCDDYKRAEGFFKEALEIVRKNPGHENLEQTIKESYVSVLKINHKDSIAKQVQNSLH